VKTKVPLIFGLAGFTAIAILIWAVRSWPVINIVETGRTPEYPDIQPRQYQTSPDRVFDAALHAVDRLPRWTLISYQNERGEIRAEARTRMLRFVDDIIIHVVARDAATVVEVRSASRIGRGDFGQNARNIRAFFGELERQLQQATDH
jgi:uncharacterized protein (DUF1499 family)